MWPVTTRWAQALTASHRRATRVEVWRAGVYVDTIDVAAGTVNVRARNRIRRTIDLTVPERLWPSESSDTLSPTAAELRVYCGVGYGAAADELVPVFRGRVESVNRAYLSGRLTVTGSDRMADVNADAFETPRAGPTGTRVTDVIRSLLIETLPDVSVTNLTTSDATVPSGLLWDRDRGTAIDDLAKSIGAEVVALPDGNFEIRPVPTINADPAWTVTDGVGGTVVADVQEQSRDGAYNVVVVLAERADGQEPLRVVVRDDNPDSPTYYDGPFGRRVRLYSSPLITDAGQAAQAGKAILARSLGITRQRRVTVVPNPALDAGDVLWVTVAGVYERHIADVFSVPLAADGGACTIETRSTRVDGDLT